MRGLLKGMTGSTVTCMVPLSNVTDSKKIYLLLLIYAASTTTTTLPCLAVVLATPLTSPATLASKVISITAEQRLLLLSSYIPFFLVPLVMTVDMAFRVFKLMNAGLDAQAAVKAR